MHSSVFDFCFFSVIFSKSFWAWPARLTMYMLQL
jgi:hypothetical protein